MRVFLVYEFPRPPPTVTRLTMPSLSAAYRVSERIWWEMSARWIVLTILLLTAIRFFVAAHAGLLWDEPYYWMWSRHLAAGYYDHPPMVAWWVAAGTALLGDGPLGLRFLFVLNTAATALAAYGIGRVLFGERVGQISALWVNVTPLLGIAGMIATPDGPSVLFWTLTILAYAMVVRTERGSWWLAVGALAGLGLLSKYTNLFLGIGIVLSLLLDARLRRWFASPWLWAGGLLAAIVFLPVVLWNADNDWISFRFQFGRLGEARFTPVYLLTLLIVQPLVFNPYAFVFLVKGARLCLDRAPFGRNIGLLITTAIPAVLFIIIQSTHGEVLQHWLAPVFPALTVAAVAAASTVPDDARHWLLRRIRTDVVPFAILAAIVVWLYALLPLDRYYPGNDPLNSIRGWPQFAADVERAKIGAGTAWIATTDYETTAELTYELRGAATVVPITEPARYAFMPSPDAAMIDQPAIIIVGRHAYDRLAEAIAGCFEALSEPVTIERRGSGRVLGTYLAFRAEGPTPSLVSRGCDPAE